MRTFVSSLVFQTNSEKARVLRSSPGKKTVTFRPQSKTNQLKPLLCVVCPLAPFLLQRLCPSVRLPCRPADPVVFLCPYLPSRNDEKREKFDVFLLDALPPREKENKSLEHEIRRVFSAVNVEEDSSSPEGFANLDRQLCEQVSSLVPLAVMIRPGLVGWTLASFVFLCETVPTGLAPTKGNMGHRTHDG